MYKYASWNVWEYIRTYGNILQQPIMGIVSDMLCGHPSMRLLHIPLDLATQYSNPQKNA